MQYRIVKEENSYIIVIEGQSIMKFRSRRQAMKLLATVLGLQGAAETRAWLNGQRHVRTGPQGALIAAARRA